MAQKVFVSPNAGAPFGELILIEKFKNNESYVRLPEFDIGDDVVLIEGFEDPSVSLVESFLMIDAARRHGAKTITLVALCLPYSRQDRIVKTGEPISSAVVANLLQSVGLTRLVTFTLHSEQIQGFYTIPVFNLDGMDYLVSTLQWRGLLDIPNLAVVSPDVGGVKRARQVANTLGAPLIIFNKSRAAHNVAHVEEVIGDPKDRNLLIVDDMVDTGGTILSVAETLKARGGNSIFVSTVHPVFSNGVDNFLDNDLIDHCFILNTHKVPEHGKLTVIDCWPKVIQILNTFK